MLQIKLYNLGGTLLEVVSPNLVMNSLTWTGQINGGQGEITVKLNLPISTSMPAAILKVYSTDEYNPTGKLVYTGIITKKTREISAGQEYIAMTALGIATVL